MSTDPSAPLLISFLRFLDDSYTVASEGAKVDIEDIAHVRFYPYICNHACTRRRWFHMFTRMVCLLKSFHLAVEPWLEADRESKC